MVKKLFVSYGLVVVFVVLSFMVHPIFERLVGGLDAYELHCGFGGYVSDKVIVPFDRPQESWCKTELLLQIMFIFLAIGFLIFSIVETVKIVKQK